MGQPPAAVQTHGGIQAREIAELGFGSASEVLDFSVNINPLGPPPGVSEALAAIDLSRYPDPTCADLRDELSRYLRVPPSCLLVGNGSSELIHLIVRLFVRRGQRPVVFAPTFSEFQRAVEAVGGNPYPWTAPASRGFQWALKNKASVLDRVKAPLVWLCNPNNPTGVYLRREQVESLAAGLTGGPLVLDEAYVEFVEDPWRSLDLTDSGRVIVLRSMTKDYALAGLRLGYLVAHPDVVTAAAALQPCWSVSSPAQAAGIAALRAKDYLPRARAVLREAKQYLTQSLAAAGFEVTAGEANFVLLRVGDATLVRRRLLEQGIAVRDCSSFGLPEFIRIGVRPLAECERLVEACGHLDLPGLRALT
jgi:histidinol-phosphate aminotransferase